MGYEQQQKDVHEERGCDPVAIQVGTHFADSCMESNVVQSHIPDYTDCESNVRFSRSPRLGPAQCFVCGLYAGDWGRHGARQQRADRRYGSAQRGFLGRVRPVSPSFASHVDGQPDLRLGGVGGRTVRAPPGAGGAVNRGLRDCRWHDVALGSEATDIANVTRLNRPVCQVAAWQPMRPENFCSLAMLVDLGPTLNHHVHVGLGSIGVLA